jgi:hypothetical protein
MDKPKPQERRQEDASMRGGKRLADRVNATADKLALLDSIVKSIKRNGEAVVRAVEAA